MNEEIRLTDAQLDAITALVVERIRVELQASERYRKSNSILYRVWCRIDSFISRLSYGW